MSYCKDCKSDCSGQCEITKKLTGGTKNSLIYNSSGFKENNIRENLDTVEELALVLPDVDYILDNTVNYMFTNELTTGDYDKDRVLNKFLNKLNFNGQRNLDVLKGVAKGYRKYGYYGLLLTDDGLVGVPPYQILACVVNYEKIPVIKQTLTYIIAKSTYTGGEGLTRVHGHHKSPIVNVSDDTVKDIVLNPTKYKNDYLVVTDKEFSCVRLDTSRVFGLSPLLKDRKRVELILNILDRMNYDIARNGIGTVALRAKVSLIDELEETSEFGVSPEAGQLLDMGRTAKEERDKKVADDMQAISNQLAETEYNDAVVYSSRFDELKQLTRDTKAIDFLDYLSQYIPSIISQMLGIAPRLFDLGKTVSNIGTHSIIDNTMRNCIIPIRDNFIGQCLPVLSKATGLEDIHFSSYEFTRSYNYVNDLNILEVYRQLKEIDPDKAQSYLDKNLIV